MVKKNGETIDVMLSAIADRDAEAAFSAPWRFPST
jgi:hypothetical protein